MWYVIGLIWLALVAGIFWAYARRREKHAAERAKQLDALLADAKRAAASDGAAGAAPRVAGAPVVAAPAPEFGRKQRLMPQADAVLYYVFRTGLPDHEIFAGLSLADLVEIAPAIRGYEREQKLRRLAQQKLDLVVCTRQLEVVAAVVIGRSSATDMAQAAHAQFIEECLKSAGIRLLRINSETPPRHHQVRSFIYGEAG